RTVSGAGATSTSTSPLFTACPAVTLSLATTPSNCADNTTTRSGSAVTVPYALTFATIDLRCSGMTFTGTTAGCFVSCVVASSSVSCALPPRPRRKPAPPATSATTSIAIHAVRLFMVYPAGDFQRCPKFRKLLLELDPIDLFLRDVVPCGVITQHVHAARLGGKAIVRFQMLQRRQCRFGGLDLLPYRVHIHKRRRHIRARLKNA